MDPVIGAVDAGRDGIKSMSLTDEGTLEKFYFKSKYVLVDFNRLKNFPTLNFDKDKDIIVKIDENPKELRNRIKENVPKS